MLHFAKLLVSTDVIVAPSIWEGSFNLSITAALAAGKPVVATAIGGHFHQITHGVNGFLSKPEPDEFAGYLVQLLRCRDFRNELGSAGRESYHEKFAGCICAQAYLQKYESLTR